MTKKCTWIVLLGSTILISGCDAKQQSFAQPSYQNPAPSVAQAAPILTPGETIEIQSHLQTLGYSVGADTVSYDGQTRQAILAYERSMGMSPTGDYSPTVLAALRTSTNAYRAPTTTNAVAPYSPAPVVYEPVQSVAGPIYGAPTPIDNTVFSQPVSQPITTYSTEPVVTEISSEPSFVEVSPTPIVTEVSAVAPQPAPTSTPISYSEVPSQPVAVPLQSAAVSPTFSAPAVQAPAIQVPAAPTPSIQAPTAALSPAPSPVKAPVQQNVPVKTKVPVKTSLFGESASDGGGGGGGGGGGWN